MGWPIFQGELLVLGSVITYIGSKSIFAGFSYKTTTIWAMANQGVGRDEICHVTMGPFWGKGPGFRDSKKTKTPLGKGHYMCDRV